MVLEAQIIIVGFGAVVKGSRRAVPVCHQQARGREAERERLAKRGNGGFLYVSGTAWLYRGAICAHPPGARQAAAGLRVRAYVLGQPQDVRHL